MDTSTGTRNGDRARATFGHLVPTTASEPRRASRIARIGGAIAPAVLPQRRAPAQAQHEAPAERAPIADVASSAARGSTAPPAVAVTTRSLRLTAIIAVVALLIAAQLSRKLGLFGATGSSSAVTANASAAPRAQSTIATAPALPTHVPQADQTTASRPAEPPRTRRRSDTVIDVATGDPRMTAARERARTGLSTFWKHAAAPGPGEGDFSLKVALPTRSGSLEHIWSLVESRSGDRIVVRISNQPVDIEGVRLGSLLTVSETQVSDWMFRRNGKVVGAESLRVLIETMPPAEAARYRAMLETQ